ncbi:uncharacterized protein N7477_002937 [Penicillium maclennaniae]|uniref:uncharacterized protein n=1 Tax=Penicillium maclennaniae TaxID=1343394 RepID=UPI00253FA2C4|nr:uncharacterized protein N7477_002937 [Penicillium maclennaniae]KAJ5677304.1 hypothetical protein N7477_002937 [Penicillium maclennaniae]
MRPTMLATQNANVVQPSSRPEAPGPGAIRRRQVLKQRLGSLRLARNFSSTRAARIILEEDDEEDTPSSPPLVHRQPKRPDGIRASKDNLRKILSSRTEKPKKRTVFTTQDRVEIIMIEHKLLNMPRVSQLGQELVDIKYHNFSNALWKCENHLRLWDKQYAEAFHLIVIEPFNATFALLQAELQENHYENRLIEHEYCKIRFEIYPALQKQVENSARIICNLQIAVIQGIGKTLERVVKDSEAYIRDLIHLVERNYLEPRKSARAKVDALLQYSEKLQEEYRRLQKKGFAVRDGAIEIQGALFSLAHTRIPGGSKFMAMAHSLKANTVATAQIAHFHRGFWYRSRGFQDPLKAAGDHVPKKVIQHNFTRSPWEVSTAMLLDRPPDLKRTIEKEQTLPARRLWVNYRKWRQGPQTTRCSPENRYLRQLDVMAPFDILGFMQRDIFHEAYYLLGSLQGTYGPMWDGLSPSEAIQSAHQIFDWATKYRQAQKEFTAELDLYRNVNWIRLQTEEKLEDLGLPNMQRQGFFNLPRLLSQDDSLFESYVNSLVSISINSWWMSVILDTKQESLVSSTTLVKPFWTRMGKLIRHRERIMRAPGIQNLGSETAVRKPLRRRIRQRLRYTSKAAAHIHDKSTARHLHGQPSKVALKDQGKKADIRNHSSTQAQEVTESGQIPFAAAMSKLMGAFWAKKETNSEPRASPKISFDANTPDNQHLSKKWGSDKKATGNRVSSAKLASSEPSGTHRSRVNDPFATSNDLQATAATNLKNRKRNASDTDLELTVNKLQALAELDASKHESFPSRAAAPAVRKPSSWKTFRAFSRRVRRRSYCTNSRFNHANVRNCSHDSLEDRTATTPVPSIRKVTEDIVWSTEDELPSTQISSSVLNGKAKSQITPSFWTHSDQRAPNGQKIVVHYCKTLESTEEISKLFLDSKVIGFDMEWKAQAFATDTIQNNLSLIQIANEDRIALFQIALFKPARGLEDFVAPTLRRILESPAITKVGVAIKADSTRLRKFLGIEARSIFELSHLFKLIKHGLANPKLVNKRSVNLSEQMEEHFGMPLEKSEDVRCGDWTRSLNYRQVQYAATDPYACLCLFNVMERRRESMVPVPPRPAHAELNQPIVIPSGDLVRSGDKEVAATDPIEIDIAEHS